MLLRLFSLLFFTFSVTIYSQSKELIDSLNSITDSERKVQLFLKIALEIKNSDWERAIKYIDLAEAEAKKTNDSNLNLAQVYCTVAKLYNSKEAFDIALQYYLKAYEIYKSKNKTEEASKLENNLAIIYAQGKNKEKALKFFLNVYHYQKTKKDPVKLVKMLNNIGTIYLQRNLDSSLFYYQKAYKINKKIKENTLKIYVCTNLARP